MVGQEDKPKMHRSARDILRQSRIRRLSVHSAHDKSPWSSAQITSNDVVLSCSLKPIASPVSLPDKQPYRLQQIYSFVNHELNSK